MLRADMFVPLDDSFSESEFSRRIRISFHEGLEAWVASPEDIVLRKLMWFDLGGRVSDKQWNDIVGVLEVQAGRLDEAYLDQWAERLGVKEMLDEARSQVV